MRNIIILAFILAFAVGSIATAGQQGPSGERQGGLYPVEFSTEFDKGAIVPPPGVNGADQLQVIFTQAIDGIGGLYPDNTFDYDFGTIEDYGPEQVDALANPGDFLFHPLLAGGAAGTATLLVSFRDAATVQDPGAGLNSVYFETPGAGAMRGVLWNATQLDAENAPPVLENLDGLEVWGPHAADDAYLFSFFDDIGIGGGSSVYWYDPGPPAIGPYIAQSVIEDAVIALGFAGPQDVDLDALMSYDASFTGDMANFDRTFDIGDEILFSIWGAPGGWDGGEIVYLRRIAFPPVLPVALPAGVKGGMVFAGVADAYVTGFLSHGGHIWNTAYGVANDFNSGTEEVDAIEAFIHSKIPSMTTYGMIVLVLLILASGLFIFYCRRRASEA